MRRPLLEDSDTKSANRNVLRTRWWVMSAVLIVSLWNSELGHAASPQVLLFRGVGVAQDEADQVELLLSAAGISWVSADSSGTNGSLNLNIMTQAQLAAYGLIIVPGGNSIIIGDNLSSTTIANVRNAVRNGVNYLGICAGMFFADGDSDAQHGGPFNNLNLTGGGYTDFYQDYPAYVREAVTLTFADNRQPFQITWWDGPMIRGGWGTVLARYPDGTAAILEGTSGKGYVLLSGVHPDAPATWRTMAPTTPRDTYTTPIEQDFAYATYLIEKALTSRPTYSLTTSATMVQPGQSITVNWVAPAGSSTNDWVRLMGGRHRSGNQAARRDSQ
jgi:hypothetical protein